MNTDFRTVVKKVTANGWDLVQKINDSHFQFKKEGNSKTLVIPKRGGKGPSDSVLKQLEKITGLSLRR